MMKFSPKLLLILSVLNLFACQPESDTTEDKYQYQHPNYIRLPIDGEISSIDPSKIDVIDGIEISEQLFLNLTDLDPNTYQAVPELASRWESNDAGDTYTFHLRQDVYWQNGRKVTAHDVVWTIKHNLRPSNHSARINTLYVLKNAQAIYEGNMKEDQIGVTALDDHTLEFKLAYPSSYFPSLLSMNSYTPLPKEAIETHGDAWTTPENLISNGSYRLKQWQKGKKLILEKNPTYYAADKVSIPEIHYLIIQESSLGLAMYIQNDLDILGKGYLEIPLMDFPLINQDPVLREQQQQMPSFCTQLYGFNVNLAPFDNLLVRKAIGAAINKRMLINFVVQGGHKPANTFTRPPTFGSVNPDEKIGIRFNPTQAQQWLAEAGYPDGKNFPRLEILFNDSEINQQIAKAIGLMLKRYLKIETKLNAVDFDSYMAQLAQPQSAGLIRFQWCGDYPDANNWLYEVFHPKQGINFIHWKNPEFARLTELAQQKTNETERIALYREAEKILNEDYVGILPLYFANATYLIKPWIKNWYSMATGGQHIRDWRIQD